MRETIWLEFTVFDKSECERDGAIRCTVWRINWHLELAFIVYNAFISLSASDILYQFRRICQVEIICGCFVSSMPGHHTLYLVCLLSLRRKFDDTRSTSSLMNRSMQNGFWLFRLLAAYGNFEIFFSFFLFEISVYYSFAKRIYQLSCGSCRDL